jgi:predicted RNase H-like nuclease (RuvC/YqgF family)
MRIWMRAFVLVPALSLAGIPAAARPQDAAQQTGDPVADAARKARETKKDTPKPKKVYTDDDLKKGSPDAVSTVGTAATATTVQTTGNATKGNDPNGEAAWRRRFKDQHDQIAKAEKELDILGRELEKAQLEYYPDPQKAMKEQNSRAEINDKTAKIDAKKKEIAQLKQALDDLEDQLRKSGGDPGWAR